MFEFDSVWLIDYVTQAIVFESKVMLFGQVLYNHGRQGNILLVDVKIRRENGEEHVVTIEFQGCWSELMSFLKVGDAVKFRAYDQQVGNDARPQREGCINIREKEQVQKIDCDDVQCFVKRCAQKDIAVVNSRQQCTDINVDWAKPANNTNILEALTCLMPTNNLVNFWCVYHESNTPGVLFNKQLKLYVVNGAVIDESIQEVDPFDGSQVNSHMQFSLQFPLKGLPGREKSTIPSSGDVIFCRGYEVSFKSRYVDLRMRSGSSKVVCFPQPGEGGTLQEPYNMLGGRCAVSDDERKVAGHLLSWSAERLKMKNICPDSTRALLRDINAANDTFSYDFVVEITSSLEEKKLDNEKGWTCSVKDYSLPYATAIVFKGVHWDRQAFTCKYLSDGLKIGDWVKLRDVKRTAIGLICPASRVTKLPKWCKDVQERLALPHQEPKKIKPNPVSSDATASNVFADAAASNAFVQQPRTVAPPGAEIWRLQIQDRKAGDNPTVSLKDVLQGVPEIYHMRGFDVVGISPPKIEDRMQRRCLICDRYFPISEARIESERTVLPCNHSESEIVFHCTLHLRQSNLDLSVQVEAQAGCLLFGVHPSSDAIALGHLSRVCNSLTAESHSPGSYHECYVIKKNVSGRAAYLLYGTKADVISQSSAPTTLSQAPDSFIRLGKPDLGMENDSDDIQSDSSIFMSQSEAMLTPDRDHFADSVDEFHMEDEEDI